MRSTSKNKRHRKQWAGEVSGWRIKSTAQLSWVKCSLMNFAGDGYTHIRTMTRHIRMSCSPVAAIGSQLSLNSDGLCRTGDLTELTGNAVFLHRSVDSVRPPQINSWWRQVPVLGWVLSTSEFELHGQPRTSCPCQTPIHSYICRWLSLNCYGGFSHWDSLWPWYGPRPGAAWMRSDGTSWDAAAPSLAQVWVSWGVALISLED